jgi:hypothetical protein
MREQRSGAVEALRIIHKETFQYHGPPRAPEDEAALASLLDRRLRDARKELTELVALGAEPFKVLVQREQIYFSACGLAATGRADVLADVFDQLEGATPAGSVARRLAAMVTEGLPLPRRSDGVPDPAKATQWIKDNAGSLVWDKEHRLFRLSSS